MTKNQTDREPVEGFVSTLDGRLHYLDWGGQGPGIHFLHGNGFCAGTYTPFLKHLIGDFRVTASDIRGHGESVVNAAGRIRHWDIFAGDLKQIVETVLQPPIIGMGHSLGAVSTYIAAATYAHLFRCIVLIDPVILPRRMLWTIALLRGLGLGGWLRRARGARQRRRVFKNKQSALKRFADGRGIFKSWSKDFIEAYLECGLLEKNQDTAVLRCDPELEAQIFESVPVDAWRYAGRIRCPTLVLRGQFSDALTSEAAERLRREIKGCEMVTVGGAGHFIPMEKPRDCARAIRQFLAAQRTEPPSN